jgi:hypothetical protein
VWSAGEDQQISGAAVPHVGSGVQPDPAAQDLQGRLTGTAVLDQGAPAGEGDDRVSQAAFVAADHCARGPATRGRGCELHLPFVNSWFPPIRRGLALGVFGAGIGGTAISAFTTVQLTKAVGPHFPFDLVAGVLEVYAFVAYLLLRDRDDRPIATGTMLGRLGSTLRMATTVQLSFLYAVAFGGFVAFSVYLPTYLASAYDLDKGDAALRTAGFVVLAVAMRPVGGWLSDHFNPITVLISAYTTTAVLAAVAAFHLVLIPFGTAAFLGMAAALGTATGAVFALVARLVEPAWVGAVTGVVGAAGGLGGFFPPLVMGLVYGLTGGCGIGFILLAATAGAAGLFTATALRQQDARGLTGEDLLTHPLRTGLVQRIPDRGGEDRRSHGLPVGLNRRRRRRRNPRAPDSLTRRRYGHGSRGPRAG